MLQRTNATTNECYNEQMLQRTIATTNKCYNEQFLSVKLGCYNEHRCYNERGGTLSADVARACACALDCLRFILGKICS